MIDGADAVFAELQVWVDSNSDGVTGNGELHSLTSLGIVQLNLQTSVSSEVDNGNLVALNSSYETADGATHAAADVWFATSASTPAQAPEGTQGGARAPTLAPVPIPEVCAPQGSQTLGASASGMDLRSRVSGLAQAMGSFEPSEDLPQVQALAGLARVNPDHTPAGLAVVHMVDAMRRFGAEGGAPAALAATPVVQGLSGIADAASQGVLALAEKSVQGSPWR